MFTGIIEEIGKIVSIDKNFNTAEITIQCKRVLEGTEIGDSISVNGVCQTVTKLGKDYFCAQLSKETLNVTNFSTSKSNDDVNLERALELKSRLGGHIVTGHIDTTAQLIEKEKIAECYNFTFQVEKDFLKYIVSKGSVTINGISLTVAKISDKNFTVALITHTLSNTNLNNIQIGNKANLEVDILSKYVENFLSRDNNKGINENFLKENGF